MKQFHLRFVRKWILKTSSKRLQKVLWDLKNNASFRSGTSNQINNTIIDNAEDPNIVMPMYNLLKYSDKYSMTSGSFWNYRYGINDDANENNAANNEINNNKTITSKSFEYKIKLIGSKPDDNNIIDTEVVLPLKYLSNFWRSLDLALINCEIELDLS